MSVETTQGQGNEKRLLETNISYAKAHETFKGVLQLRYEKLGFSS